MNFRNPTPLRVGARGSLHGWEVTVAARVVLGVEINGETYYWNEYHLVGANGTTGTLVYEEVDVGPEWKLFRTFTPERPLTAREAMGKRVGDMVNLDGMPTAVTLVDESRVYHIEGEPPEGVEVGDVAYYFNADMGQRMLVASWTGDEIEFYEGEDAPAELIAQAFGFRNHPQSNAFTTNTEGPGSTRRTTTIVVIVLFVLVTGAVLAWKFSRGTGSSTRRTATATRTFVAAPATKLPLGAHGRLGEDEFTIVAAATVNVARVRGRQHRHEYQLKTANGELALLIQGLQGSPKEWHLLRPLTQTAGLDPYELAAHRKNAWVNLATRQLQVGDLFSTETLALDGEPAPYPAKGTTRYGFVAQAKNGISVVARWNESGVECHSVVPVSESDVVATFRNAPSK